MDSDYVKSYQTFQLRPYQDEKDVPVQMSKWRFVLEEISGEGRQQAFGTIEQVMNFLLDELQVPKKEN